MRTDSHPTLQARTIRDFGDQWHRFRSGPDAGFYGSVAHLADTFGPLLEVSRLAGTRVAEIGSGSGRFVNMLLDAGAAHVTAVEPSSAVHLLRENTAGRAERVAYVAATGENLPLGHFDFVFSVGVLMHIPDPRPVVARAFEALRPGGEMLVWLYAREGNEAYLALAEPLRRVTTRVPDAVVVALSHGLNVPLSGYIQACRVLPLPRQRHMRNVMARMSWRQRTLVIFDQLNPAYARYYRRAEAEDLLRHAGFEEVEAHHRHGYSWAVRGRKPS